MRRARPATDRRLDDPQAPRREAGESEDVDGEGLTLEQAAAEIDRLAALTGAGTRDAGRPGGRSAAGAGPSGPETPRGERPGSSVRGGTPAPRPEGAGKRSAPAGRKTPAGQGREGRISGICNRRTTQSGGGFIAARNAAGRFRHVLGYTYAV